MRVFLDTNVLAAALGTRGICAELLATVIEEHELLVSRELLDELDRVLSAKFRLPGAQVAEIREFLEQCGMMCMAVRATGVQCPDPDDLPLLQAAATGGAACFVTGDKALLAGADAGTVEILNPRGFWAWLRGD